MEAVVALGAVDAAVLGGDADAPPLVVGIVLVALALEGALVVLARGVLVASSTHSSPFTQVSSMALQMPSGFQPGGHTVHGVHMMPSP